MSASVLTVRRPEDWATLEAAMPLAVHVAEELSPTERVVLPSFEAQLKELERRGLSVLVRYARRPHRSELPPSRVLDPLHANAVRALRRAQRHAVDDVVHGWHAWDPVEGAQWVDALFGAGYVIPLDDAERGRFGRYRIDPRLPAPPEIVFDFEEAFMPQPDDLEEARPGPVRVLQDMAALAAALQRHPLKRTRAGHLERAGVRRLGATLGDARVAEDGRLEHAPRWVRAHAALEALGVLSTHPTTRLLTVEPTIETVLAGSTSQAIGRLLGRLIPADLAILLAPLAAALRAAGDQAVDEMIFLECLEEEHRDLVYAGWWRDGERVYPSANGDERISFDQAHFELVEARMVEAVLRAAERLGVVRRAPGVFCATEDGALWAEAPGPPRPPVWVTSDLELTLPPGALTPWERYQLERIGRCVTRDVVDRLRLERKGFRGWLRDHTAATALELLERRALAVPSLVRETLLQWERDATTYVLTRGVLLDEEGPGDPRVADSSQAS